MCFLCSLFTLIRESLLIVRGRSLFLYWSKGRAVQVSGFRLQASGLGVATPCGKPPPSRWRVHGAVICTPPLVPALNP